LLSLTDRSEGGKRERGKKNFSAKGGIDGGEGRTAIPFLVAPNLNGKEKERKRRGE